MTLAWKRLATRLGDNTWSGRADISEVENIRIIRIQISQLSDRAVVELYGLKWQ